MEVLSLRGTLSLTQCYTLHTGFESRGVTLLHCSPFQQASDDKQVCNHL